GLDARLIKAEHAVVVRVGELVKEDRRLMDREFQEVGRVADLDRLGLERIVAMVAEPGFARMVLRAAGAFRSLARAEPDRDLAELDAGLLGDDARDVVELRLQEAERLSSEIGLLLEEHALDADRPALDRPRLVRLVGRRSQRRRRLGRRA